MRNKLKKIIPLFLLLCMCIVGMFACSSRGSKQNKVVFSLMSSNYVEINEGESYLLTYSYNGEDAVVFSSTDSTVATVSDEGLIQGVSAGETFVEVTVKDVKKTVSVKVVSAQESIILDCENVGVVKGSEKIIKATCYQGSTVVDGDIVWSVDGGECEYEANGATFYFKSETTGYYTVTAKYNDESASCILKVVEPNAVKLEAPVIVSANCKSITWSADADVSAKIDDGAWFETTDNSLDIASDLDDLEEGEYKTVYLRAVAKTDFAVIDSYAVSVNVGHSYDREIISEYDCEKAGEVKFICSVCDKTYIVET